MGGWVRTEVEANVIRIQHAPQQVLANRKGAEYLRGGERGVEEKAGFGGGEGLGDEGGEDEEVETVDPNEVCWGRWVGGWVGGLWRRGRRGLNELLDDMVGWVVEKGE